MFNNIKFNKKISIFLIFIFAVVIFLLIDFFSYKNTSKENIYNISSYVGEDYVYFLDNNISKNSKTEFAEFSSIFIGTYKLIIFNKNNQWLFKIKPFFGVYNSNKTLEIEMIENLFSFSEFKKELEKNLCFHFKKINHIQYKKYTWEHKSEISFVNWMKYVKSIQKKSPNIYYYCLIK